MNKKYMNFFSFYKDLTAKNSKKIGFIFFNLGIFFLSSALPLSVLFLIISISITIYHNKQYFFKDKWNISLLITSILMITSCIYNFLRNDYIKLSELQNYSLWIDLFNWIPLFIAFFGFQEYLKTKKQRFIFANSLIFGSVPVFISCAMQKWFGIYGPLELFNSLIVWYQDPPSQHGGGLTGLFSNPNYTGFWLAVIWPFILFLFHKSDRNFFKRSFFLSLLIFSIFFIFQTNSRNAILSLLVSLQLIFTIKVLFLILIILIASYFLLNFYLPMTVISFSKVFDFLPRIEIWTKTLFFIKSRPIFGWGGATFPIIYLLFNGSRDAQHTHNISLQLAYSYGIPVALILTTTIFLLFFKSYRKIISGNQNLNIDKVWLTSAITIIIYQSTDITYYDGKISILIWALLGGLKCILEDIQ